MKSSNLVLLCAGCCSAVRPAFHPLGSPELNWVCMMSAWALARSDENLAALAPNTTSLPGLSRQKLDTWQRNKNPWSFLSSDSKLGPEDPSRTETVAWRWGSEAGRACDLQKTGHDERILVYIKALTQPRALSKGLERTRLGFSLPLTLPGTSAQIPPLRGPAGFPRGSMVAAKTVGSLEKQGPRRPC